MFPDVMEKLFDVVPFFLAGCCAYMGWYELPKLAVKGDGDVAAYRRKAGWFRWGALLFCVGGIVKALLLK